MNPKRLLLAIIAVFVAVWITDFLIHSVWLMSTYNATASLWRSQSEMGAHIGWLFLGQLLWSITFVLLYAKGFAALNCLRCACIYGFFMGVFFETNTLVSYAVQPLPGGLAVKWFVANVVQAVLAGAIAFFVYKPKPDENKSSCC